MPKNKVIVKFPTLNDKGGDVSKQWYVEYYYYYPNETKPRKRRIYTGLCVGTAEDRYAAAKRIIEKYTAILKSPNLLTTRPDDTDRVLSDDIKTRPEADRYAAYSSAIKAENLAAAYTDYIKGAVSQKTHETYRSKLHIFVEWLKQKEVAIICTNDSILSFFQYLANQRNLTKRSILKYKQILHSFYDWVCKKGYITTNPVYNIPAYGRIVDNAPAPMSLNERKRLKLAIEKTDPYLWLACEIQYYCAIRPGTELRLLKVGDINIQNLTITVRQENAKNRHKETVPMPERIAELIIRLGIMSYDRQMYVFGANNIPAPKPVGKNTLRNRFNKYRDDLGISKTIKFYSWKHTGAISMVENGISVWELQHHMRHSSIATTEEYIRQRASQSRLAQDYIDDI